MAARNWEEKPLPTKGRGAKPTARMLLFCEEYMKDLNATEAYMRAGYKFKTKGEATQSSYLLMKHPHIKAEITRLTNNRAEKYELTTQYVVERLQKIVEETGQKPEAVLRGLELLGRHLGMYRDRQEISGPDGEAIRVEEQKVQNDVADFRSRIAGIAARGGAGNVLEFPKPEGTGKSQD